MLPFFADLEAQMNTCKPLREPDKMLRSSKILTVMCQGVSVRAPATLMRLQNPKELRRFPCGKISQNSQFSNTLEASIT